MERTSFADWNCSVARALEQMGDWWTLLIIREAMFGTRRFSTFQRRLGISRNILSRRLEKMVRDGLLERAADPDDQRGVIYELSPKGKALFPVLLALMQWGDAHAADGPPPMVVTRRDDAVPLPPIEVRDADGARVPLHAATVRAGPGADPATRARLEKLNAENGAALSKAPASKRSAGDGA